MNGYRQQHSIFLPVRLIGRAAQSFIRLVFQLLKRAMNNGGSGGIYL